jgi:hypothetical protein
MSETAASVVTRAETIAALVMLNALAKRDQHIIERFTTDPPSTWTKRHRSMDAKLDELVGA